MNTTRYHSTIHTIRNITKARESGYGNDCGVGYGCGYGLYIHHMDYMIYTADNVQFYYILSDDFDDFPVLSSNYNGAGSSYGKGDGYGVCHNIKYLITDYKGLSWCNRLLPLELDIEKAHG